MSGVSALLRGRIEAATMRLNDGKCKHNITTLTVKIEIHKSMMNYGRECHVGHSALYKL